MTDNIIKAYNVVLATPEKLDEGIIKNALVAATTASAIVGGALLMKQEPKQEPTTGIASSIHDIKEKFNLPKEHLLSTVKSKFKISDDKAEQIVNTAIKHSDPVFPKAHHILAISGIESSFNENAKSKLKSDPAIGLMQIRPRIWNIDRKELSTIDGQIKHGAHILKTYHQKTGSIEHAIKSYNVGITNFLRGKKKDSANRYHDKFKSELDRYTDPSTLASASTKVSKSESTANSSE